MEVKLGSIIIPNATVKRFIDLQSGLPLSMIEISYVSPQIGYTELLEAFKNEATLLFQSEILNTLVQLQSYAYNTEARERKFILLERDISSGYKSLRIVNRKAGKDYHFLVPENIKKGATEELEILPYIRFILKKDVPEWLLE